MILENTKLLLEEKYNNDEFSSYAVLLYKNGEKEVIMSPDVDEYTYSMLQVQERFWSLQL